MKRTNIKTANIVLTNDCIIYTWKLSYLRKLTVSYFFIYLFLNTSAPLAQQNSIIQTTPQAAIFEKYVDHEVDLKAGIPIIEIPLYTLEMDGLKIPIMLKYHASGIKYRQYDGDVAAGWALEPGYRMTRKIYGKADELFTMPTGNMEQSLLSKSPNYPRDRYLASFALESSGNGLLPFPENYQLYDGLYDQFTFMLPTLNGHFIMKDRELRTAELLEKENNILVYIAPNLDVNNKSIDELKITDDRGFQYGFGKSLTGQYYADKTGSYKTSWPLLDIVSPTGKQINFRYFSGFYYSGDLSYEQNFVVQDYLAALNVASNDVPATFSAVPNNSSTFSSMCFIQQIVTDKEVVNFFRVSKPTSGNYKDVQTIEKIEVNDRYSGARIRQILFSYTILAYHRLLDSVTIIGEDEQQTYRFTYYRESNEDNYYPDQYGYYHRGAPQPMSANRVYFDLNMKTETYVSNRNGFATTLGARLLGENRYAVDRSTIPVPPTVFSLKQIIFPTGGHREYEYESHKTGVTVGGLRIKNITTNDGNGNATVQSYRYGTQENGMGFANFELTYKNYIDIQTVINGNGGRGNITTYSTQPTGSISTNDFEINYPQVTVYEYDANGGMGRGKTEYYYDVAFPYTYNGMYMDRGYEYAYHVLATHPYQKTRLKETRSFKFNGIDYELLKQEQNTYETKQLTLFNELKTAIRVQDNYGPQDNFHSPYDGIIRYPYLRVGNFEPINSYFVYHPTSVASGQSLLKYSTITDYTGSEPLTYRIDYSYNSNYQLSTTTTMGSDGNSKVNIKTYPGDYTNTSGFLADMKNKNLLSYPIEEVNYITNGTTLTILGGTATQYQTGGKGLIDRISSLKTETPIPLASFKFSNRSAGLLPPAGSPTNYQLYSGYTPEWIYDLYDNNGNPLQVTKVNGLTTTYLWGYNGQYPIAKIVNATYAEVLAILGQTLLTNLNSPTVSDATIAAAALTLRNHTTMKKAQVSTYTYKPLVGMTSMTDPRGITEYYQYDGFQRLKDVLDFENNVLKDYRYHYRP